MHDIFAAIAHVLLLVVPDWVRLPGIGFVLPHWLYWGGLALFPLCAMYMVRKSQATARTLENRITLSMGYLFLITGGLAGLHRFYLRSARIGYVFIALFAVALYSNHQGSLARNQESDARNAVQIAAFEHDQAENGVKAMPFDVPSPCSITVNVASVSSR